MPSRTTPKRPSRSAAADGASGASAVEPTPPLSLNLSTIERIAEITLQSNLSALEVHLGNDWIRVERGGGSAGAAAPAPIAAAAPALAAPAPPPLAPPVTENDAKTVYVTSPFVGVFYRAASPGAAPFVEVSQPVKKGQVMCIVEAFKLMNQIEAEVDGVVIAVLVENEQSVEYGEPLFKLGLR